MPAPLIAIVAVIYLVVAFSLWREGNWALAWSFLHYSLANIGFIILALRGVS